MAIAIITAGGTGVRFGNSVPKQFITVNEKPVIVYTLEAFQSHPEIDVIAVVCIAGWEQVLWAYTETIWIFLLTAKTRKTMHHRDSSVRRLLLLKLHSRKLLKIKVANTQYSYLMT